MLKSMKSPMAKFARRGIALEMPQCRRRHIRHYSHAEVHSRHEAVGKERIRHDLSHSIGSGSIHRVSHLLQHPLMGIIKKIMYKMSHHESPLSENKYVRHSSN